MEEKEEVEEEEERQEVEEEEERETGSGAGGRGERLEWTSGPSFLRVPEVVSDARGAEVGKRWLGGELRPTHLQLWAAPTQSDAMPSAEMQGGVTRTSSLKKLPPLTQMEPALSVFVPSDHTHTCSHTRRCARTHTHVRFISICFSG